MLSRRQFLTTVSASALAAAAAPACTSSPSGTPAAAATKNGFKGVVGVQLWSLRDYLPKDLVGGLKQLQAMGVREVEGAGLWGRSVNDLRKAMDDAGLRCQFAHMDYERLRDDSRSAFAEAKAMGATWVVCPWLKETVNREDILKAADVFNVAAKAAHDAGLRFAYHCHGYEFIPATEGTLFDTLAQQTDASLVEFQIDVFHAFYGGADPVKLITQHGARVSSLHLKDLKKGVVVTPGKSVGTADIDVPVGTGQLDMSGILAAASAAGTQLYYVEDESADPLGHIPQSLAYLKTVTI